MTTTELMQETVHTGTTQTVETEVNKAEQPAAAQERKVRVGFTAAILEDGEFVFNVHGASPGLVELHGLVHFAKTVVDVQMKNQLNIDEAAILDKLEALTTQVTELAQKVK